ncbi:gliding motility-associated C-terminal domain-containing protein [Rubrolithibacter danxiaensis]|uniref:T9SS type B sorting domain-containing protein n=1 Tax=Rubrolithibacter danxiaensis TaxID=3390805 RepID=UPI003BF7E4CA
MKALKILLTSLSLFVLPYITLAQQWKSLGPIEDQMPSSVHAAAWTSVATDVSGTPYIFYQDGESNKKATVKKYNEADKKWETVGSTGFSKGSVSYTSIAVNNSNGVFIAYRDEGNANKAAVKRFNAVTSKWEAVGAENVSTGAASFVSIAVDRDNILYLLYQDEANGNKPVVKKFNSESSLWTDLASSKISTGSVAYPSITIDGKDIYIAFQDVLYGRKVTVKHFVSTNGTWETLGSAGFSLGAAAYTSIAVTADHIPYVAYQDSVNKGKLSVQCFDRNKASWQIVGTLGFTPSLATYSVITFDKSGAPVVAFSDGSKRNSSSINRFNKNKKGWETVSTGFSSGAAAYISVAKSNKDVIYVTYQDGGLGDQAVVKQLNTNNLQWEDLGGENVSSGTTAGFMAMAVGADELPYIVYQDEANFNKATVRKYNKQSASWEILGNPGLSDGSAAYTSIAVGSNNIPYVVYQDGASFNKVSVKWYKSSTGTWEVAGTEGFSAGSADFTAIALDQNNIPFVVYRDASLNYKAVVKKYNSSAKNWETIGAEGFSQGSIAYITIAINKDNIPYVSYRDDINSNRITVKRYNSVTSSWENVGATGFSAGSVAYTSIAIDSNNMPYVVYQDITNGSKATVKRFNSSSSAWETVGTVGISSANVSYTSIAIDKANIPYVIYQDKAKANKATVKKFNIKNGLWESIGTEGFSSSSVSYASIAVSSLNKLTIAYRNDNSGFPEVQELNTKGEVWLNSGAAGISSGSVASFTSIAVDQNNIPYLVYSDESNSNKAVVKRYNKTRSSWEILGAGPFSKGGASYTSIAVAKNNEPFIVFSDAENAGRSSVYKYNAITTNWEPVGLEGFSAGAAAYTQITTDKNNVPYVVYQDEANGKKITVQRFNSNTSTWDLVGSAGFSPGIAHSPGIAIDQDNNLYVAYQDATTKKVTVNRYNSLSSAWEVVGPEGFSDAAAEYVSIATDQNNVLYVVYKDGAATGKATVKRFDAATSSWETVGKAGFSGGTVFYTAIAINKNNVPFVVYRDGSNTDKATVQRFKNEAWETVGAEGFSTGAAAFTAIALGYNDKVFAACQDAGAGKQAMVFELNEQSVAWDDFGDGKVSGGALASWVTAAIDKNSDPIVIYRDDRNKGIAGVTKYDPQNKTWKGFSTAGLTESSVTFTGVATDKNNIPYIIYRDENTRNKAIVKRYNDAASSWETLGNQGPSEGPAAYTSIAIDGNNIVYAAFQDSTDAWKAVVKRFNVSKSTWELVGKEVSDAGASFISLRIDKNNVPYVAFQDSLNQGRITVKCLSGTNWKVLGEGISKGLTRYSSLEFDNNNTPWIAYQDIANNGKATVQRYNAATKKWETVGLPSFSFGAAFYSSLAFDQTNTPYIVYRDDANANRASVQRYNNTKVLWEAVGQTGFSVDEANYTNIISSDNKLFVVYADNGIGKQVTVKKLNQQSLNWEVMGVNGQSEGYPSSFSSVTAGTDGIPYIAFADGSRENKVTVKKYNAQSTAWEVLEASGLSAGPAKEVSIAISSDNTPYIVYEDESLGDKAVSKRFNPQTWKWEDLGVTISTSSASAVSIAADKNNNTPYIIYRDGAAGGKATVRRFNSLKSDWENVGKAGFSEGRVNYTDLIIGADNSLFIAYQDEANGNKATVQTFDSESGQWQTLGKAGVSMGIAYYTAIAVGTDNTPYIFYRDEANGGKATVQYFDKSTSSWKLLGTVGFTPAAIAYADIQVDKNNIPYITYRDTRQDNQAVVKRYNRETNEWETVGQERLSRGNSSFNTIALTDEGRAYVAFQDAGEANQVVVKELNSNIPGWQILGSSGISSGTSANNVALAVNSDSTPYIAFSEGNNGNKLTVKKYNGVNRAWETVGRVGITNGAANYISLAICSNKVPFVAYQDGANYNKASVKHYNAKTGNWESLGSEGFSEGIAAYISIATNKSSVPYVVYQDASKDGKASVQYYNSGWKLLGAAGISEGRAAYTSIAIDHNDIPYIAYQDLGDKARVNVKRYVSGKWENVGSGGISAARANFISIALDKDNLPYIAYQDSTQSNKITVKRFNSADKSWKTLGPEGFSSGAVSYTSIAVDSNNVPYVLYPNQSKSSRAVVRRYNADKNIWEISGEAGFSKGVAAFTNLVIGAGNKVYAGFKDAGSSNAASVKLLNNKAFSMETTGMAGLSEGAGTAFLSLRLDKKGVPYVIYQDAGRENTATVKKYNSEAGLWEAVGSAGFSAGGASYTDIAISENNTLYSVYSDVAIGNKVIVKQYNADALSWETVGTEGISPRAAAFVSMVSVNDTLYIAYQDKGNSDKAAVKKYNPQTGAWTTLDPEGVSSGTATYTAIAVGRNNIPYILYQDGANQNKATVKAYNAKKKIWEALEKEGISAGEAAYTSLAIDSNNQVYIAYQDFSKGGKATVKRYNTLSSKWETVGMEGFSAGEASFTAIQLDEYNIPYVVYRDGSQGGKVTVSRFNRIKKIWEVVTQPGLSEGAVTYPAIAIAGNSLPYIAYSSSQAFAQAYDCVPAIESQPEDLTVCVNTDAVFSVSLTGANNSYQWQVNDGSGFKDITESETFSGVNTNVLKITSAPITFKGYKYRCLIIGSCVVMSNEAALNFNDFNASLLPQMLPLTATESRRFEQSIEGKGGEGPYKFSIASGSLPPGLILSSDGKISGTPVRGSSGSFSFSVKLQENSICHNESTASFNLVVNPITADMVEVHPVVTPNGDSKNDFLEIFGIEAFPENHLLIVNRNGTPVFDVRKYDNQQKVFSGRTTFGVDNLPAGTYFYLLEYKSGDEMIRKNGYLVLRY